MTWRNITSTWFTPLNVRVEEGGGGLAYRFQRLATGWTVRRSDSGREEMFRTRQLRPWCPPSLLYRQLGLFPGVKRPERGVDHPLPSSAEVKERVELYLYSASPVAGWIFTFLLTYIYIYIYIWVITYTTKHLVIKIHHKLHGFAIFSQL
jgi:hypothetical protein